MIDWDPSPLPGFLGATGILWGRSGQKNCDLDILFPTNPKVDHLSWFRIREFPEQNHFTPWKINMEPTAITHLERNMI